MHALVTRFQAKPDQVEDVMRWGRSTAEEVRGFTGIGDAVLLLDGATGNGMTITLWERPEAMQQSAASARQLFGDVTSHLMEKPSTQSFEVTLHRPFRNARYARA